MCRACLYLTHHNISACAVPGSINHITMSQPVPCLSLLITSSVSACAVPASINHIKCLSLCRACLYLSQCLCLCRACLYLSQCLCLYLSQCLCLCRACLYLSHQVSQPVPCLSLLITSSVSACAVPGSINHIKCLSLCRACLYQSHHNVSACAVPVSINHIKCLWLCRAWLYQSHQVSQPVPCLSLLITSPVSWSLQIPSLVANQFNGEGGRITVLDQWDINVTCREISLSNKCCFDAVLSSGQARRGELHPGDVVTCNPPPLDTYLMRSRELWHITELSLSCPFVVAVSSQRYEHIYICVCMCLWYYFAIDHICLTYVEVRHVSIVARHCCNMVTDFYCYGFGTFLE